MSNPCRLPYNGPFIPKEIAMQVQVAVLCDAATDSMGKLNILGAFDALMAREFPIVHPMCAVAVRLMFERHEEGTRKLEIRFVDDDGHEIIDRIEGQLSTQIPPNRPFVSQNMVLNLQRIEFKKPGRYEVDIFIDGTLATAIPLSVLDPGQMRLNG